MAEAGATRSSWEILQILRDDAAPMQASEMVVPSSVSRIQLTPHELSGDNSGWQPL